MSRSAKDDFVFASFARFPRARSRVRVARKESVIFSRRPVTAMPTTSTPFVPVIRSGTPAFEREAFLDSITPKLIVIADDTGVILYAAKGSTIDYRLGAGGVREPGRQGQPSEFYAPEGPAGDIERRFG